MTSSDQVKTVSARKTWVDVARGGAIILVVLMHVREWHYGLFEWPFAGRWLWDLIVGAAGPLRMPLFFTLSGLLASSYIRQRPIEHGRTRLRNQLYLYGLWLSLYALVALGAHYAGLPFPLELTSIGAFAREFLIPTTGLWYLYALAIYFMLCVGAVKAKVSGGVVIGLGLLVCALAYTKVLPGMTASMLKNFGFFAIGVFLPGRVAGWARFSVLKVVTVCLSYLAALATLFFVPDVVKNYSGLHVLVSLIGLLAALQVAALLDKLGVARYALSFVGRRTLGVFLLHPLLIGALTTLALTVSEWDVVPSRVGVLYPLLVGGVVLVSCLLLNAILLQRFRLLREAPSWRAAVNRVVEWRKKSGVSSAL